jgi:26S proteasome regulatory subunit N10
MGKLLKKNSVAVDIINIGEIFENDEKLTAFYNAVNSNGNPSHLITVPPGPHILSDFLISASSTLFGDG